jgi:hypothetical protein
VKSPGLENSRDFPMSHCKVVNKQLDAARFLANRSLLFLLCTFRQVNTH